MQNDPYRDVRDVRAEHELGANRKLASFLEVRPQAFMVPRKDGHTTFLIVWLYLLPELVSFKTVCDVCFAAFVTLAKRRFHTEYAAIEIVTATLDDQGDTQDKILRVTVDVSAISTFMQLDSQDLRSVAPTDGVRCTWYPSRWSSGVDELGGESGLPPPIDEH